MIFGCLEREHLDCLFDKEMGLGRFCWGRWIDLASFYDLKGFFLNERVWFFLDFLLKISSSEIKFL